MVFVQIYISGPGPWSSQTVSYFSGQWSRSATGGIHARPNFPGFSCLATFVIYTTTQTQTHLRQNIAKRKNKFSRLFLPAGALLLSIQIRAQKNYFIEIFSFNFVFSSCRRWLHWEPFFISEVVCCLRIIFLCPK